MTAEEVRTRPDASFQWFVFVHGVSKPIVFAVTSTSGHAVVPFTKRVEFQSELIWHDGISKKLHPVCRLGLVQLTCHISIRSAKPVPLAQVLSGLSTPTAMMLFIQ